MELSPLTNAAFAGIAVFGLVLAVIAALAYRRAPSPRIAMVAVAFGLVALQGVVVGIGLFLGGWDPSVLLLLCAGFEALVLGVLFAATLLR